MDGPYSKTGPNENSETRKCATRKEGNIKKVQHGKSASRNECNAKHCNMKWVQHETKQKKGAIYKKRNT